ncbi:hypothetical protein ACSBOB_09960 [Mesorhizobium sp. ASY16-5R]|jgi:hypothetical protein|uniref:hypothetical protein n=1 Tax=Mesorhizobium sp. ASY16-5R TaxID=3445772 RepID=UPI003F9FCC2D
MRTTATTKISLAFAAGVMLASCTTAPAPPDTTAAAIAASKVETAGATKVGPASRPGFCTFKTAAGGLYEAKC